MRAPSPTRYLTAAELAQRTGYTVRYFQALAASGKIKWAYQPAGERGAWRFAEDGFVDWWEKGQSGCHGTFTSAAGRGGSRKGTRANATASALKHRLSETLKLATRSKSLS